MKKPVIISSLLTRKERVGITSKKTEQEEIHTSGMIYSSNFPSVGINEIPSSGKGRRNEKKD